MSTSKFPARVETSVAVRKGRSIDIRVANPDGETGNHGGSITVMQEDDAFTLVLNTKDGRSIPSEGGSAYATLTKLTAQTLCRNLAVRLGIKLDEQPEAEREEMLEHANNLEIELMQIANGQRKPGKISLESVVRLIHYARTGTIRNATIKSKD